MKWWEAIRAWLRAGIRVEEVLKHVDREKVATIEKAASMAVEEAGKVQAKLDNLANVLVSCPECGGVYNAASNKLVWAKIPMGENQEPMPVAFCKWDAQRLASKQAGRIVAAR